MQFSRKFFVNICFAFAFLATVIAPITADAQVSKRENFRLKLLDQCVYSEHKKPKKRRLSVKGCKCAAKKAIASLGNNDFGTGLFGGMTGKQKNAMQAARAQCR